ncbi:MAG TPA: TonB-dependent receptor [Tepidisphaeraceae bacterium]|jgi:outer membrane receptor protein involved in Fe transport|nr:TonB-dependent receptor [Tepidisphaeraceae bacterium]
MRWNWGLRIFVLAAFCLCSAHVLFAQANAQLTGTVTDPSGAVVAKVPITLRDVGTNVTYSAASNDNGFYAIANLPPGTYELKASFSGFSPYTQTGIVLTVGESGTANVALELAGQGEKVVVTTQVPTIEPTKTEISQVVNAQQIQSLPISGRLFTDFALLTPGVATSRTSLGTTFTEFETTQISFGGMRSFSNEVTVDGADFVNELSGVQRATPPQEAVQEFRVVNNSFGAEYGRALGGIVNVVTKSGTNDVHGSVYDYLQNSAADARSPLQHAPLPHELRQNQFGGTIGGPIVKDKTFLFMNYEGKRRAESPTFAPDLFNNIGNVDLAKSYLGLSPEGCYLAPARCTAAPASYLQGVLKTANNDYGFVRLDHQISTNNRLAIRYSVEDARDLGELIGDTEDGGGIGTPSGGRGLFVRDQSLFGTVSSVLSPNVVNTALVQYARRHYNFPGETGEPDLSVVNDLEFGHNFGTYDAIYESRVEGADSVSWVKGSHIAKFGFDGNYVWDQNNYPGFEPERILFPNLACMFSFADTVEAINTGTYGAVPSTGCPLPSQADGVSFLYWGVALPRANCPGLTVCANGFYNGYVPAPATGSGFGSGWPNAFPTNMYSNFAYKLNHGYWGIFAQDQWRLTPKLTLNYGLRWDVETGLGNVIDADYRAFQPRIGLAWSPDDKTVVRAGFGIFFDRNNMTFFFTTGNQKTVPGYFCANGATPASCVGVPGVNVPMINKVAANGGWQLSAQPGYPGTPALPCVALGLPNSACNNPAGTGTLNTAALTAYGILAGAPYSAVSLSGPCTADPITGAPTGACGVGSGGIQKNGRLPYAEQASLEIDRQIGGGFTLDLAYLFVGAHKLVRGNNLNVPCPLGTSKPDNPYDAQGLVNPNGSLTPCSGAPTLGPFGLGPFFATLANPSGLEFGVPAGVGSPPTVSGGLLDYNNNVANSNYNGFTVTGIERLGKYFNLTANYTYSHVIDNGNFTTFINLPPNQFDYSSERGNSNQDVRHHFVTNFTATAPEDNFLRHFQFSSIITLESGRPFTLFAGENTFGDVAGLSTDRVGGPPVTDTGNCASVMDCSTIIGRNTYVGDPLYSWDLRLSRYFQITERLKLDLAVDAFNMLNRANLDEITSVYGSPVFCGSTPVVPRHFHDGITRAIQSGAVSCSAQQVTAVQAPVTPANSDPTGLAFIEAGVLPTLIPNNPNPVFGEPRTAFNPREFQFSAKFSF